MRLFFAAMLPEAVQNTMGKLRGELSWIPTRPSWSPTPNLHITLKFIGEAPDPQVNEIAIAAREAIPKTGVLTLRPSGLVFFPPRGDARVLGIGFSGMTQELVAIESAIEAATERLGFPREARAYSPHATLARFKDGLRPVHRQRVEQCCAAISDISDFTINSVQLMQSKLSSKGSEYTVVAKFPLE